MHIKNYVANCLLCDYKRPARFQNDLNIGTTEKWLNFTFSDFPEINEALHGLHRRFSTGSLIWVLEKSLNM